MTTTADGPGQESAMATSVSPQSVCIVGAGPAGLVAAKTLLYHRQDSSRYSVCVYDGQPAVGGLWPASKTDNHRLVHPLMISNQSKHTMHFSDQSWDDGTPQMPRAWMVGRYLQRYLKRYLSSRTNFDLRLSTWVERAEPIQGGKGGWRVLSRPRDKPAEWTHFDRLVVASGHFGRPIIPKVFQGRAMIPVIHSSQYRDLKSLLPRGPLDWGKKILVVGGQMSGVEIAGTIASHLSSAFDSPDISAIPRVQQLSVHHVIQRPIWVFPLYTTPEPYTKAPKFLPLDFASYDRSNRPPPLENTQGHISEYDAHQANELFKAALGTDQAEFSPLLRLDCGTQDQPPYLAVSDWYCDFVRDGRITLSRGKVASFDYSTAVMDANGERICGIAAVVLATGFDSVSSLRFLPGNVLSKLYFSPNSPQQPLALQFHGTIQERVPNLGFVGFYRSPYWGIMQMQARFLAEYWSGGPSWQKAFQETMAADDSVKRTVKLRDDPRRSQFPMGDYPWLMQEFAEALPVQILRPCLTRELHAPYHREAPLEMLTPSQFLPIPTSEEERNEALRSIQDVVSVTEAGLSAHRFVARAVFRSLLGSWSLERTINSRQPAAFQGRFSGLARFFLRDKTEDGYGASQNDRKFNNRSVSSTGTSDGSTSTDRMSGWNSISGTNSIYSTSSSFRRNSTKSTSVKKDAHGVSTSGDPFLADDTEFRSETGDINDLKAVLEKSCFLKPKGMAALDCSNAMNDANDIDNSHDPEVDDGDAGDVGKEFLYVEEGLYTDTMGTQFQATRAYIWRYDEARDALSVWFVKPNDRKRADYLFHDVTFQPRQEDPDMGWQAEGVHLCCEDLYNMHYSFNFKAVNLQDWTTETTVTGPKKEYTIHGSYTR